MNYQVVLADVHRLAKRPATLVVVSKGHSWEEMLPAYRAGCRDFGESRLQEALEKQAEAPQDIRWHFIGPLQKNKVRKAVGRFALIHSVDTPELAERIANESREAGIETALLLQANISGEATKQGLPPDAWKAAYPQVQALPSLRIEGLMTLAPFTEDVARIQRCFAGLASLRAELKALAPSHPMQHLSMGMSHDYPLALQEGATLLRIGTAIFEEM